jgi:hypothetical protein
MPTPNWRDDLPGRVRVMQIIIAALVAGCVFFAVIAIVVSSFNSALDDSQLITFIALGIAVLAMIPRVVVPSIMVPAGRKKILRELREKTTEQGTGTRAKCFDEVENEAGRQMTYLLQRKTIISAALVEGPALFLLVAYMVEHSPISLAAAGILVVILALHFPTFDRTSNWIEGQLQLLKDEF